VRSIRGHWRTSKRETCSSLIPPRVREHEISIVPNVPHTMSPSHDAAVVDGGSEAEALGVDAWLTEDQAHVVKIASHRTPGK
jgi:hypothetical protein